MSKKKKLYLFTDRFPYGWSEKTFILPELKWLTVDYDATIVSSALKEEIDRRELKTELGDIKHINVEPEDITLFQKIKYSTAALFDKVWWKELSSILKSGESVIERIRSTLGFYAFSKVFWKRFEEKAAPDYSEGIVFYSYWLNYQTFSSLRKKEMDNSIRVVSRVHGVDLFQERNRSGWQPFRRYMGERLDGLFFAAEEGREYYISTFMNGSSQKTFHLCRLGVRSKNNRNPFDSNKEFKLVSCSNVIEIKRVDLIIQALSLLDEDTHINWIHFGDGVEMENMKKIAGALLKKKTNISYKFAGFRPNDEIMDYYEKESINCFITTSKLEGCPVSVMEALSFGIPVIATDVGGVSETIDNNGVLLNSDPTVREVADAIIKVYNSNKEQQKCWRDNSYYLWKKRFDESANNVLIRELMQRTCN